MMKENILLSIIDEVFKDYIKSEQYVKNNLFNIDSFQFCKEMNNIEYGIINIELHGFIDKENKLKAFIINNVHFVVEDLIIDVSSKFLYFGIKSEVGLITNIHINVIENYKKLRKDKLCLSENFGFYLPCSCYSINSDVMIKDDINILPFIRTMDDIDAYHKIRNSCIHKFYPCYNLGIYLLSNKVRLNKVLDILNDNLSYYHLYINYSLDSDYLNMLGNLVNYYSNKKENTCDITFLVNSLIKNKLYEKFKNLDISLPNDIISVFYKLSLCFDTIKIKEEVL